MKQILQDLKTGKTSVIKCPSPKNSINSLKISSKFSLISAGTERMLVDFGKSSYIEKARKQPEKVKQVISKIRTDGISTTYNAVKTKLSQPITLGYSNVGIVTEVDQACFGFKIGDRVVSNGPHADEVVVNKNLCALIPDTVDDKSASFTIVGSIALQGVRLANPTIGESFVVFGAGLVGLLTIQILKANGCDVLAVDFDKDKLLLAKKFGAETFDLNDEKDLINYTQEFTNGLGADGIIITASTDSNEPIHQAAQICRKKGRIILVGVVGLDINRQDFYEKEITFQVSCSYGPGRYDSSYEVYGNDYPVGYVRWTEQRNFNAFLKMLENGSVNVKSLISKIYSFEDAPKAYEELTRRKSVIGILLDYKYEETKVVIDQIKLNEAFLSPNEKVSIGFIGAGNYASRILIPSFKKLDVELNTLVTAKGINSVIYGDKFRFLNASSDVDSMMKDKSIDTVVIATQHNTHAKYIKMSLEMNKHIWVEKPIALNFNEIQSIKESYKKAHNKNKFGPQIMVGFNRRFSPHVKKMHSLISSINAPKSILITINAGSLPTDHWTQDLLIGGGRIIGECCHFIDLIRFLVGSKIVSVNGKALRKKNTTRVMLDNSSIIIEFDDGSVGTILYLSNGANSFSKERIEIFVDGKVLQLDNFRKLKGFGWKNFKKMNLYSQDKGQDSSTSAFIESIKSGKPCIPAEEIFEVAEATLKINEILLKK